jgi:uncharacterized membrane protein
MRLEGMDVDWLVFSVHWLHVLAAITWFGAVIYTDFILIPGLMTLPAGEQRSAGSAIGKQAFRVIMGAATAVIILGILRGTVFGPIRSVDALTTAYGLTWLLALVVTLVTYWWGLKVIGGALERFNAFPLEEATLADGSTNPALAVLVNDVKRKTMLELVFFFVIFTCMILMRFGL